MRHAILGAGGLGGLIGAALARQGHEVTLLVRDRAIASHPRRLRVESAVLGDFEAEVLLAPHLDFQPDVVWITVKSTQLEQSLTAVPPGVLGSGLVLPLLNGIDHMDRLREVYGDRVLGGVMRVESERVAPGHYRQPTPFANIEVSGRGSLAPAAVRLASEVAATGLGCRVQEDELTMLWGKLCGLAAMALATTALQLPVGGVRDDPEGRRLVTGVAAEAVPVAQAEGARLELAQVMAFLEGVPAQMRSSMQKDREAGRSLEVDAIGGPIVRRGRMHAIPTPITELLVDRLRRL